MSPKLKMDKGKPATVLVDFDGVIHQYERWDGSKPKNAAVVGAYEGLCLLRDRGIKPDIYTSRPIRYIDAWLRHYKLRSLVGRIIGRKPYYVAFFDDRAFNVKSNEAYGLHAAVSGWLKQRGI